jgi:tetratricopeptide (TPR) repeat protein/transcriptional regulator with XRE-family HTH domain
MASGQGGNRRFGDLLREHRVAAGFTQEQLAERSGLGTRTIRDLERGRVTRPHRESIALLATALGLPAAARDELALAGNQLTWRQAPDGPAAASAVPRQLPPAVPHFAGRSAALKVLADLIADIGAPSRTVVISAIDGTAGIGKTALAVYWAHQVAERFPDGQLYINLRGFDPGGPPLPPAEAIRTFLHALGVPQERIPAGLEAQAAQYRSMLAGKKVLVLLDNARDAAQVRPLLPGSPGSLVLVTSRTQMLSLVAAEGAHPLPLDLFTVAEARELLARRLGPDRVSREQQAADELIGLCARLPLALNIVAARAADQPSQPLADLAAQLHGTHRRLDLLDAGDPVTDVRAVFSWSYQGMATSAARMFRLLGGVHPGPDISVAAAASLAGGPARQARLALSELTAARLVIEHPAGRFFFHDLLREYAAEQAHAVDGDAERHGALRRVLDHYLHTACHAAQLLVPSRMPIALAAPQAGTAPEALADDVEALAWLDAEYPVLLAVLTAAVGAGLDEHAWQLPWALSDFLPRRGRLQDYVATHDTALAAAQRLLDRGAQAYARREIGYAYGLLGSYPDAHSHLEHALDLYRQLGDRNNEAITILQMAHLWGWQDRNSEAREHALRALEIAQAEGQASTQANALNTIGWYDALLGDFQHAIGYCQRALELLRGTDDKLGQAATLDSIGYIYLQLGSHRQALDYYQQALGLFTDIGDHYKQAEALIGLGNTHQASGDDAAARRCWQRALVILTDLDHPDADIVRGKLGPVSGRG